MTNAVPDDALEREVLIHAPRDLVFRYFTEDERFARWWGKGSTIDARPGGAVRIVHPGGTVVVGEVLEVVPRERIAFTYGNESGEPIPPGGSRVTVTFEDDVAGTRVRLIHAIADPEVRGHFVQGWRYQLAVFANVAAADAHADAAGRADRWFAAWNEMDAAARRRAFTECAAEGVVFQDGFSCTRGIDDLNAHVGAAKVHMPGITITRAGDARQCQGVALVPWKASGPGGEAMGAGTNVFEFTPDGRIARTVGFW